METKPWYQSKIIGASLATSTVGIVDAVNTAMSSGEVNKNSIFMAVMGLVIAILRKKFTNTTLQ